MAAASVLTHSFQPEASGLISSLVGFCISLELYSELPGPYITPNKALGSDETAIMKPH